MRTGAGGYKNKRRLYMRGIWKINLEKQCGFYLLCRLQKEALGGETGLTPLMKRLREHAQLGN